MMPAPIRCVCGHMPRAHIPRIDGAGDVCLRGFERADRIPCECASYRPAHAPWIPPAQLLRRLGLGEYAAEAERFAFVSIEWWLSALDRLPLPPDQAVGLPVRLHAKTAEECNRTASMPLCSLCRRDWPAFAALLRTAAGLGGAK